MIKELKKKQVKMVMSNANVPLVTKAFPAPTYKVYLVSARRSIHSKDPAATTNEVLIAEEKLSKPYRHTRLDEFHYIRQHGMPHDPV